MLRLITLGILAGFFFSSTFVLNRLMSLEGGHWLWSAALRYFFMIIFLGLWFAAPGSSRRLKSVWHLYLRYLWLWTLAGTIGFGCFYALITYSATYAPAWVVAATWQSTILATPLVLLFFGHRIAKRALLFSLLIFIGVLLINLSRAEVAALREIILGSLPVLLAAVCYPLGNQLVWEAETRGSRFLPRLADPLLSRPFVKVFLLTLGSLPFWSALLLVVRPPWPAVNQLLQTAAVALCSGIIATGLFLHARQLAGNAYQLTAVDATQASEVLFALALEMVFLGAVAPTPLGLLGIVATVFGLGLYLFRQAAPVRSETPS
jgi:drug/metabolite transporter (DMT)-like permease